MDFVKPLPADAQQPVLYRPFSQVYVEEAAFAYSETQAILQKIPEAEIIRINAYQEVFHRPQQSWSAQRKSRKLILAVKKDGFIYPGADITPNFGHKNYFYNSPILNCLYDCEYCYLQGMYASANVVVFVNTQDYLKAVDERLSQLDSMYLCISYDTDLLAFDHLISWTSIFHEYASAHENCLIELRTKSAQAKVLEKLRPISNFILAWTISPQEVIERFEHKTPSLQARLEAAKRVADHGFPVRICMDPILDMPNAEELYQLTISKIFEILEPADIQDISLGVFRIGKQYFKDLKKNRGDSMLVHSSYVLENNMYSYKTQRREELVQIVKSLTLEHISPERIHVFP